MGNQAGIEAYQHDDRVSDIEQGRAAVNYPLQGSSFNENDNDELFG